MPALKIYVGQLVFGVSDNAMTKILEDTSLEEFIKNGSRI